MLIVTPDQMKEVEKKGILKGDQADTYMENAGKAIAEHIASADPDARSPSCILLLGPGNNAGDALVAGRYLIEKGWSVLAVEHFDHQQCSPLYQTNYNRFISSKGTICSYKEMDWDLISQEAFIIDGLLGPLLNRPIESPMLDTINLVNQLPNEVVSIDIPSGLNGLNGKPYNTAIKAVMTIATGLPKIGYFLENAKENIGMLICIDFGLNPSCLETISNTIEWLDPYNMIGTLPKLNITDHKYQRGAVSIVTSKECLPGATCLASLAALRSGCGIVFCHSHQDKPIHDLAAEIVQYHYQNEDLSSIKKTLNKSRSLLIGPGFDNSQQAITLLTGILELIKNDFSHIQLILDATAITLLGQQGLAPPKGSILTPHLGELRSLIGSDASSISLKTLELAQTYADKYLVTLVIKSHNVFIFHPQTSCKVFSLGDPGMATAGTGDVLAGIISSLIAQGDDKYANTLTSIALHCLCGLYAAESMNSYSMIASDLIDMLPLAINSLDLSDD